MPRFMLLALVGALGLAGCAADDEGGDDGEGAGEAEVALTDNAFTPATLTVASGTEVGFENMGERRHTVTIHWVGDPGDVTKVDKELAAGAGTEYDFPTPGTYHVWCTIHGEMTSGMAMVVTAT